MKRRKLFSMRVPSTFVLLTWMAAGAGVVAPGLVAQKTNPTSVATAQRDLLATPNAATTTAPAPKKPAEPMRLTTKSDHSRELFGEAVLFSGNYRLDECLKSLRAATSEDGNFAAGWALLSYLATDSKESAEALARAQSLAGKISPSEMLFVRWVTALKKNNQLAAISDLNDLVHRETGDKFVLYLAGRWFVDQHDAQRAIPLFEKVLEIDPQFTPVLNRLGYSYAAMGDMARAELLMQRYVAAMPADANPEDSYGDILFKAGRYAEAKEHFEHALKKDPTFGPSQHELGDVFAMLGNQAGAREAYEKSAKIAANPRRNLEYRGSIALSYVREGMLGFADREYAELVAEAHVRKYSDLEAGFREAMAMYQADDLAALKQLDAAETAIREDADLAAVTRDEHMAVIRRWRGVRSLHYGNAPMAEVCLHVLEERYEVTDNEWIGSEMHALRGALFAEQKKPMAAIAELEQTGDDAYSLDLLARTKRESGDSAGADAALRQMLGIHASTMESVLVVEPARTKLSVTASK
jgi:tetratricopeptide (TPR) repeat protein